jgi:hypothetical protein
MVSHTSLVVVLIQIGYISDYLHGLWAMLGSTTISKAKFFPLRSLVLLPDS